MCNRLRTLQVLTCSMILNSEITKGKSKHSMNFSPSTTEAYKKHTKHSSLPPLSLTPTGALLPYLPMALKFLSSIPCFISISIPDMLSARDGVLI